MTTPPPKTVQHRREQVRAQMRAAGLAALLITAAENRQYLTGFLSLDHEAGSVLLTHEQIVLLTDDRYSEQAHEEAPDCLISVKRGSVAALTIDQLKALGWTPTTGDTKPTLGIEAEDLTVAQYQELSHKGRRLFRLAKTNDLVETLRLVKDPTEIAMTRRATEITEQTFTHLCAFLAQPEVTEKTAVAEIIATFLRLGADGPAFDPIVAAGPMGARPHAVSGQTPIAAGVPIVIDMGARFQGYCADMTRTVFLDHVPAIWATRYRQVLAAQLACERGLHAGIGGRAGDDLARDVLKAAGLEANFTHSTGHGTGLAIHEGPNLSQRVAADATLPEGAIVTVEPGVYFPGEGGIRIEDAVVITATGCEVLTKAPKDLAAMIIRRAPAEARR